MAGEFDLLGVQRKIADLPFAIVKPESPDAVVPTADLRAGPILRFDPYQGVALDEIEADSFGSGYAKKSIRCTLGYALLLEPVGTGRIASEWWPRLLDAMSDIVNTFAAHDVIGIDEVVDVQVTQMTQAGPVQDMAGNLYHGARIRIAFVVFFN